MNKENKGKIVLNLSGDWRDRLHVEADYYHDCNAYGCDEICRCGTIESTRIKPITVFGAVGLAETFFQDGQGNEGKLGFALAVRFLKKLFENVDDLFVVETCGGYYGDEIEGVFAKPGAEVVLLERVEEFNKRSNSERVRFVLEQEYDSLLPEVEQYKSWKLIEVPVEEVYADKEILKRCSNSIYQEYVWFCPWHGLGSNKLLNRLWNSTKGWYPAIVAIPKKGGGFRVIDGFHRYKAWTTKPYGVGQQKWKRLRLNKTIKIIAPVV